MKIFALLAAGVLFLFSSSSFVQAEPAPLTVQEAVKEALDQNPDVRIARDALTQSRANTSFAISKALPALNAQVNANYLKSSSASTNPPFGGNPYNQYTALLALTQPLYDGAIWAGYKYSQKDEAIKSLNLEVAERTLTQQVLEAFYSILFEERQLHILQDTLKVDEETLAVGQRYFKIGRAQKIDVLQLQTQTALLVPQIAQMEDLMRTNAATLAQLLRKLDANSLRIKGALATPDSAWVKEIIKKRKAELPEVVAARETVEQFGYNRDITMAAYWPKLDILGQMQRQAYTKRDLIDGNNTSWSIGLQLNIPLFAGLGSFRQREALAAQEHQLELTETKTADTVSVSQIQTERDLQVAQTTLETSKLAAMYGRESLKEAQRTYRLQTINYLQYQSSAQAYLTSETGYFQAKYNYIIALAKYFNAIGVPPSELVAKLEELSNKMDKE
jgi:outer membrane protein